MCTNILVGMQPTLRQVPPKVPSSTIATSRCGEPVVDDRVAGAGPDDDQVVVPHTRHRAWLPGCRRRTGLGASQPAGDPERRSRDVRGLGRQQPGDRGGDLVGYRPTRPSGTRPTTCFSRSGAPASAWIRVSVIPGATPTTRMPRAAVSFANPKRQRVDARLGGGVVHIVARRSRGRGGRRDVDDRARRRSACRTPHRRTRAQHGGGQVEVDDGADDVRRRVLEPPEVERRSGVVDQRRQPYRIVDSPPRRAPSTPSSVVRSERTVMTGRSPHSSSRSSSAAASVSRRSRAPAGDPRARADGRPQRRCRASRR